LSRARVSGQDGRVRNVEYVDRLGRVLVGRRSAKRELLREVADHLEDATEAYVADGVDRLQAERLAREEFGSVAGLAPSYQVTLAADLLRRTSTVLAIVLVAQPLAWAWYTGSRATGDGSAFTAALETVVEAVGLLSIGLSVVALLLTGLGTRWLGLRPGVIRAAATAGLAASVVILGLSAAMVTTDHHASTFAHVPFALVVVGVPFGWVARQSWRCLRAVDGS
jgi:hypothetical protein